MQLNSDFRLVGVSVKDGNLWFWIGPRNVGVASGLSFPELQYHYTVIDVREIEGEFLLDSEVIGEASFAILCKLRDVRGSIARIASRIRALNPGEQREALLELFVLAGLRGLTEQVREETADMPLQLDIHENEFLEQIWRKGQQEGHQVGLMEGERGSLLRIIEVRFGPVGTDTLRRIEQGSLADLRRWGRSAISAPGLYAVFD